MAALAQAKGLSPLERVQSQSLSPVVGIYAIPDSYGEQLWPYPKSPSSWRVLAMA